MFQIWLIPVSVALCIIIISLFHPQIMEPYVPYLRSYMTWGDVSNVFHQNVIDHRGHARYTEYMSDVMFGKKRIIPPINEDNGGNEDMGPSHTTPVLVQEGFWGNMNRLEDSSWYPGKLDHQFKSMLDDEKHRHINLIKSNVKHRLHTVSEGFGSNRAPEYWNKKDYPIVTSNGLNLTPSFPQDGVVGSNIHKSSIIKKLWGHYDDPIKREVEEKMTSRTLVDHKEKR
jgi:hypothetical protein